MLRSQYAGTGCADVTYWVPEAPGPLVFHAWAPGEALHEDRFGIPAPQSA